jgi:septum formation protein
VARTLADGWVLGADTVVARRGTIYGKPAGPADGAHMLGDLAGRWHWVHTGLALVDAATGRVRRGSAATAVKLRALDPARIRRFGRLHLDKAGSYAAQARGNPFVERVRGDHDNVVGLPLRVLKGMLKGIRSRVS